MYITNIKWDIDLEEGESYIEVLNRYALPTSIKLPECMDDTSIIGNWLSDRYGFCHDGFIVEQED